MCFYSCLCICVFACVFVWCFCICLCICVMLLYMCCWQPCLRLRDDTSHNHLYPSCGQRCLYRHLSSHTPHCTCQTLILNPVLTLGIALYYNPLALYYNYNLMYGVYPIQRCLYRHLSSHTPHCTCQTIFLKIIDFEPSFNLHSFNPMT